MENKDKIILDLYGGTGAWSNNYKEKGYTVHVITWPDYDILKTDLLTSFMVFNGLKNLQIHYKDVYGILCAPPCTDFSIARNDKTAKRPRDLKEAMKNVKMCLNIIWECRYITIQKSRCNLKFWALENPRGYLIDFLGKPCFIFDPCDFGDTYTKKTCLWGNFNFPTKDRVEPIKRGKGEGTFVKEVEAFINLKAKQIPFGYKGKSGYSLRKIVRSITPEGFSKAFYEANK